MVGKNERTATNMWFIALAMFGFGFALIPLYDVICEQFALDGRVPGIENGTYDTSKANTAIDKGIDTERDIGVTFLVIDNTSLDFEFRAETWKVHANPGSIQTVNFYVKNNSDHAIVAQARPQIDPTNVWKYFHKMECFCFTKQTLQAGEERKMPLKFVIDPALPKSITDITLSYMFYDTGEKAEKVSVNTTK